MLKFVTLTFLILNFFGCAEREPKPNSIIDFVAVNDSANVAKWLNEGGDPNYPLPDSSSLLYLATGPHGGNQVMELLVKAGAKINKGAGKYTPLMNAASWTNYDAVTFLLDNGADPNLMNENGQTALEVIGVCKCEDEIKTRNLLTSAIKATN